jgi:hypothetical protein
MFRRESKLYRKTEANSLLVSSAQIALLPKRISTRTSVTLSGRESAFVAWTADGAQYVCKEDRDTRPVRASEWICTALGRQLGIATAACEIIEDDSGAETFFGSQFQHSARQDFELKRYLSQPSVDELGRTSGWLGRYLAQLYAFDLFVHNDDRSVNNLMLNGQTLIAIDFASARLDELGGVRFPVAPSATVSVGKNLRRIHGFDLDAALEMTNRISGLPVNVIEGIMKPMPSDWLSETARRGVTELWQNGHLGQRLDALRGGLTDGSLL